MHRIGLALGLLSAAVLGVDPDPVAPDHFCVELVTTVSKSPTQGRVLLNITRELAPHGVDRFHNLVQQGYYDANGFFRVVPSFVVQFGISGDPAVSAKWKDANIPDDAVKASNVAGTIAYASAGPNTRTTQLYVNTVDNTRLDGMGFQVFGNIVGDGLKTFIDVNPEYGQNPDQGQIYEKGNAYLKQNFPNLDYLTSASIVACQD
eukprot:TRINITY_DN401_c1_g1_i1.p1 TRINITY_DN401_c1_g1~~TRINITY_DN401_c1_g1_i1.p1  ORF type:complete len:205 (+),score=55.22 TRINITY_DN401_c1_g1_i1:35-649(+)